MSKSGCLSKMARPRLAEQPWKYYILPWAPDGQNPFSIKRSKVGRCSSCNARWGKIAIGKTDAYRTKLSKPLYLCMDIYMRVSIWTSLVFACRAGFSGMEVSPVVRDDLSKQTKYEEIAMPCNCSLKSVHNFKTRDVTNLQQLTAVAIAPPTMADATGKPRFSTRNPPPNEPAKWLWKT